MSRCKATESIIAVESDGSFRPASMWESELKLYPKMNANSCCVSPFSIRSWRIRFG